MWDATIFGVFNQNFPLYIKHEDLSEIAHGGQCLSISVIQLWILVRAGNSDVYGFLEPQSIKRSGQSQFESESYIKSWIQSSKRDVYLGAYLNSGHWQMVVILPKENLVVWFCSLYNRPDNYLKGIINSALKGLDDTLQPKSKAAARWIVVKCNRQKGITECGYYVMHWMSMIILGSFRNNWETYFNEVRPLEAERFKALRIQWAHVLGIVFMIVIFLSKDEFAKIFTNSEDMIRAVADLAYLLGVSIMSGVAVGSGWQVMVGNINLACVYVVGLPIGIFLGFNQHLGVKGGTMCGRILQMLVLLVIIWKTNWSKEL
ncbi:Protein DETOXIFICATION 34 [Glycine max]|nr:Protein DETOXIFICATION 34 [Glycine max]